MKLDAYVQGGKDNDELLEKKYQNIISNTQSLVYTIFGTIGPARKIVKDPAKTGNIGELPTGIAKDYIHNQSNEYPIDYVFGHWVNLENCSDYGQHSLYYLRHRIRMSS